MPRACPTNQNYYDLVREIKDWAESDINKKFFRDPYEAAFRMVESEFHGINIKLLEHNPDLSAGQVGSFKARLRELSGNIRNGSIQTKWLETWWRPSTGFAAKDPVVGKLLRGMQRSGFHFRANEMRDKTLFNGILQNLKTESQNRSNKYFHGMNLSSSQKKLDKLDDDYRQAHVDWNNKDATAADRMASIKREMNTLIKNSELKVYDDMLYLIEGKSREEDGKTVHLAGIPKLLQDKYIAIKKSNPSKAANIEKGKERLRLDKGELEKLEMENGDSIKAHPDMYEALTTYMNLTDGLYKSLKAGVGKILKSRQSKMEQSGYDTKLITSTLKSLEDKLMPRYEDGYFPHYTRDLNASFMDGLMKHVEDLQNTTSYSQQGNKSIEQVLKSMKNYVDGHVTGRNEDYDYSRNFVNSISNYIGDVNRFNFASFMDAHIVDSLTHVEKVYKSKGEAGEYAQSIVSFIEDMHMAVNGDATTSKNTRAMMKTLLGFEFISKLGFSPRTAARNFTQRLLDYVHWGPIQIKKSHDYLEKMTFEEGDYELYIEKALRESGLLFQAASPEYTQSGLDAPASMFKTREWNDAEGKWEMVKKTKMEKIAKKVEEAAGTKLVTGMHRWAENSNRKHTFKIGFAQMHRWLRAAGVKESMAEERSKTKYGKKLIAEGKEVFSEKQYEHEIRKQARNYAINMVIFNHFDYGDYAKNKASRTKMGRFMLQFQHYSFEFFENNLKIVREAKHDVKAKKMLNSLGFFIGKDTSAHGLEKAYRMGLAYFLPPFLISQIFGVNASNLIEHDTIERIKQWFTYFTSEDDDEVAAAFFGKGPILGTVGGPLISDVIDIGVMMDLIDLDEDGLLTLISGLESNDPSTSTEVGRKLKIANTFLGRLYERHYPAMRSGQIGFAAQQEFGFYPTAEARKRHRKKKKEKKSRGSKRTLPMNIEMSLSTLLKEGQPV